MFSPRSNGAVSPLSPGHPSHMQCQHLSLWHKGSLHTLPFSVSFSIKFLMSMHNGKVEATLMPRSCHPFTVFGWQIYTSRALLWSLSDENSIFGEERDGGVTKIGISMKNELWCRITDEKLTNFANIKIALRILAGWSPTAHLRLQEAAKRSLLLDVLAADWHGYT